LAVTTERPRQLKGTHTELIFTWKDPSAWRQKRIRWHFIRGQNKWLRQQT